MHGDLLVLRDRSGFSGGPSGAEEGLEGKIQWVVSQGQIRGSQESLAETRCPIQAPWSGDHELHLGVRQTCLFPKTASSWMCHLPQSPKTHEPFFLTHPGQRWRAVLLGRRSVLCSHHCCYFWWQLFEKVFPCPTRAPQGTGSCLIHCWVLSLAQSGHSIHG